MPYIKELDKQEIEKFANLSTIGCRCKNAGELNYTITRIIQGYFSQNGGRYQQINDVVGALEGAKLEFYRRLVADYENQKIVENGDVY
jgi:hypothetical protein